MLNILNHECRGYQRAILSYEGAYLADTHILEHLSRFSKTTTILILIRNQVDWINSSYNQQFKSHRKTITDIYTFDYRREEIFQIFDINKHLLSWGKFFDLSQIKVIPYEPSKSPYDAVLESIGIPRDARKSLYYPIGNPNKAADLSSIRILYYIKKQIGDNNQDQLVKTMDIAHRRLKNRWIDTRSEPGLMLLREDEIHIINDLYRNSNRELIARYRLPDKCLNKTIQSYSPSVAEQIFQLTEEEIQTAEAILSETA